MTGETVNGRPYEGASYAISLRDAASTFAEGKTCDIALAVTATRSWLADEPLPELFTIVS